MSLQTFHPERLPINGNYPTMSPRCGEPDEPLLDLMIGRQCDAVAAAPAERAFEQDTPGKRL